MQRQIGAAEANAMQSTERSLDRSSSDDRRPQCGGNCARAEQEPAGSAAAKPPTHNIKVAHHLHLPNNTIEPRGASLALRG